MSALSNKFGKICKKNGLKVVTVETFTGGLIAATIAQSVQNSEWLYSGFVISNQQSNVLDIDLKTIEDYGMHSLEVAQEMAVNALKVTQANLSISVTGIPGPQSGTMDNPVGTVWMAIGVKDKNHAIKTIDEKIRLIGNRNQIRQAVASICLEKVITLYE